MLSVPAPPSPLLRERLPSLQALLGGAAVAKTRCGLGAEVDGGAQTHKHRQAFGHLEEELPFGSLTCKEESVPGQDVCRL